MTTPANPPSAAPLDLDAKAEAIGPDDPRWMECLIDFAEQSEDRLAELALRLPHGDFDEADVSMVDEARFALTQLVAAAKSGEATELTIAASDPYAALRWLAAGESADYGTAIAHTQVRALLAERDALVAAARAHPPTKEPADA